MMHDKRKYIANRYLDRKEIKEKNIFFNGFHSQKGKRAARPFSSFYPEPESIQINSIGS